MRWLAAGFIMAGAAMAQAEAVERGRHKGYEVPPYRVEAQAGDAEVRRYAPHLVAEVTVAGDRTAAIQEGFGILAGYIFGRNETGAKIAMTTPVSQVGGDGRWTVRFMMPEGLTPAALPAPRDARIRFVTAGQDRQAVMRFSGMPTAAALDRHTAALRAFMDANRLDPVSGPHFAFYDSPMTLPWTRRNEVAFTLAD
jgi:hypothetical protein